MEKMSSKFGKGIGNSDCMLKMVRDIQNQYKTDERMFTIEGEKELKIRNSDNKGSKAIIHYADKEDLEILTKEDLSGDALNIDILHHSDLDGDASAALILNSFRQHRNIVSRSVAINYVGASIIDNFISKRNENFKGRRIVFVLDITLKNEDFEKLLNAYDKVVWIDHHETSLYQRSISLAAKHKGKFTYFIYSENSACWYTHALLYSSFIKLAEEFEHDARISISRDNLKDSSQVSGLISIYDTKKDKKYPEKYTKSLYLQQLYSDSGMMQDTSDIFTELLTDEDKEKALDKYLEYGKKLYTIYMEKLNVLNTVDYTEEFSILDLKFKVIYGRGNSTRFDIQKGEEKNVVNMIIHINKDKVNLNNLDGILIASIYTDDEYLKANVPMSYITNKYFNGGGHAGAAGFNMSVKEFLNIFDLDDKSKGYSDELLEVKDKNFKDIRKILNNALEPKLGIFLNDEFTKDFKSPNRIMHLVALVLGGCVYYEYLIKSKKR